MWPCSNLGVRLAGASELPPAYKEGLLQRLKIQPLRLGGQQQQGEAPSTSRRTLAATGPRPVRILPEYQLPVDMAPETASLIRKVVDAAVLTLQGYVQVRTPVGSGGLLAMPSWVSAGRCSEIRASGVSTTCAAPGLSPAFDAGLPESDIRAPVCGPARINASHVMSASCFDGRVIVDSSCSTSAAGQGGVLTDLYVYITAAQYYCAPSTAAFALPCMFASDRRPIMGTINLCNNVVDAAAPDKMLAVVIHEMLHVLGITSDMFGSFIDGSTGSQWGLSKVVATVPSSPSPSLRSNYQMIITPTVVREVRDQFGCPSLAGAILEDQGGSGSMNSHWEHELFQGDIMTPTAPADGGQRRISRVTLALVEDSGWYYGNWTAASHLEWGRNAGCGLPTLTCAAYMDTFSTQPFFCDATDTLSHCTFDGRSHGFCAPASSSGFSRCGLINTLSPAAGVAPRSRCISEQYSQSTSGQMGVAAFGWATSPTSRCLKTLLPLRTPAFTLSQGSAPYTAYCWNAECGADEVLHYRIDGVLVPCPAGTTIQLSSIDPNILAGAVVCPDVTDRVCSTLQCPAGCSPSGGDCLDGACACRLGFVGADCGTVLLGLNLDFMGLGTADGASGSGISQAPDGSNSPSSAKVSSTTLLVAIIVGVAVLIITTGAVAVAVVMHRKRSARRKAAEQARISSGGSSAAGGMPYNGRPNGNPSMLAPSGSPPAYAPPPPYVHAPPLAPNGGGAYPWGAAPPSAPLPAQWPSGAAGPGGNANPAYAGYYGSGYPSQL
ncbi:hypothetical protein FOA52_014502 [Chlamydomonas sp. UWO 241]|nr:hypothetical protein FOA52_014502 [Chlamydomonas sp. UWO 241]